MANPHPRLRLELVPRVDISSGVEKVGKEDL
jgi:hypothetical protein